MAESNDGRMWDWRAGSATAVITPEHPMWMAGFGARDRPSSGVHQEIHAKVLVLEDTAGTRTVIASLEILFVGRELREDIVSACESRHGIPPDHVLLNASHTHQGPVTRTATNIVERDDGMVERIPKNNESAHFLPFEYYSDDEILRERTESYADRLVNTVVELVGDAVEELSPAELRYGRGRCASAMSRRRPTTEGVRNASHPEGPYDPDVPVLAVSDPGGDDVETIRTLVFGYASHTSSQFLYEYSGDWAGYAQAFLEDRLEDATALFLMGCAGDQKPYPQETLEQIKAHARAVVLAVEAALDSPMRPVRGPIQAVYSEIDIQFEGPPSAEMLQDAVENSEARGHWRATHLLSVLDEYGEIPTEYPLAMQALGFGTDLTLLAMAGEPMVGYANRLKDERGGSLWMAGYSNDAFTYVPTARSLPAGGYEPASVIEITALPGPCRRDVEERVVAAAHALADRVETPPG